MTCARSRAASAGPMPRTRSSASSDPNGPCRARSSTMRCANAGPIPGNRSSASASATSRSTRPGGGASTDPRVVSGGSLPGCPGARPADGRVTLAAVLREARVPPAAMAESTRLSCSASADWADGSGSGRCHACHPRAPTPSAATAAMNSRAWRSAGVGTPGNLSSLRPRPASCHRGTAPIAAAPGIAPRRASHRARRYMMGEAASGS